MFITAKTSVQLIQIFVILLMILTRTNSIPVFIAQTQTVRIKISGFDLNHES